MNNLTKLGHKFGTDKVDEHHSFAGECYTDIYHKYLQHLQNEEFNFLEIGVRNGASVKMWSEYFPRARIIGLDIDPLCKQYDSDRINIEIGSQGDKEFIESLVKKYGKFRVVLDDGSHINTLTLDSLQLLNDHVEEFYIIEDLRNSYENLTVDIQYWGDSMKLNNNLNPRNDLTRVQLDNMLLTLIKNLDYRQGNFKSINFHAQILVMEKFK
jgi:hypothetical protein